MQNLLTPLILYKDDSIIVINKPSGIASNNGRGKFERIEQHLHEFQFDYPTLPALAHRLDVETSGCLIIGRTKNALSRIGKMFMAKRIEKTYLAIVEGNKFEEKEGRIDIPLRKKSAEKHHWHMEAHPSGKEAITDYKILGTTNEYSLLELHPRTGRTHQLRVHCAAIGHPIIGDKIYGNNTTSSCLHLHAHSIKIPQHDKPAIDITAPPPQHMSNFLNACKY